MNQDPLLQNPVQQMNPVLFQQLQQQMNIKDYIGDLDRTLKELSPAVLNKLTLDQRFSKLNSEFQNCVQQELLSLVKARMNANTAITDNIKEQMKIIEEMKKSVESEKEASINEMNDYIKNYSTLTFDEYRRMKNGEPIDKTKL